MSGLVGCLAFDGSGVARATVEEMAAAIAHRGRDDAGAWCTGSVALGHRLRHATPEAAAADLPRERDGLVITADARIDNRAELVDDLEVSTGAGPVTDCRLILAAYERWGEACPERLVGAYAFAIWDGREGRLFAARDHAGLRPFYYHRDGDRFAFGSEIKALWTLPWVPRDPNEGRIAAFLSAQLDADAETFYRGIHRLPPAHSMVVTADGVRTARYWEPDPDRELRLDSDEAYAERFRELFTEAVRCRLRRTGPVGATLSGGLDSSSVVVTARELLRDGAHEGPDGPDGPAGQLHTFSAVFDRAATPESDEREFIDAVVDQGGVTPHRIRGDRISPLAGIDRILWHQESPEVGNNFYLHWAMYAAADRTGVGVLLDGLGGDTTVSHGFGALPELAAGGRWLALAREVRGLDANFGGLTSKRTILRNLVVAPFVPDAVREAWRAVRGPSVRERANPALDPAFCARVDLEARVDDDADVVDRTERAYHRRLLTTDVLLLTVERWNKTAAAFDVEPRFPFLDRRLMEFCLALPPAQKLRRGWTRYVLRRAMDGLLPEAVQWRGGKGHLGPSFWRALREHGRAELEAALLGTESQLDEYLDVERVRAEYEAFVDGADGGIKTVWYPAMLGRWLTAEPVPNL